MMVMTFFHELGHIHCFRTGTWREYHADASKVNEIAECWVACWAEQAYNREPGLRERFGQYVDGYIS